MVQNSRSSVQGFCRTLSSYWKKSSSQSDSVENYDQIPAQDQPQSTQASPVISDKQPSLGVVADRTTQNLTTTDSDSEPDYEAASISISTEWAYAVENSDHVDHVEHNSCDNPENLENSDLDSTLMELETWSTVVQKDRNWYVPPQASDFIVSPNISAKGHPGLVPGCGQPLGRGGIALDFSGPQIQHKSTLEPVFLAYN